MNKTAKKRLKSDLMEAISKILSSINKKSAGKTQKHVKSMSRKLAKKFAKAMKQSSNANPNRKSSFRKPSVQKAKPKTAAKKK